CGVLVGLVLGLAAGSALADGDPASDVLYFQDVFLPYARPSPAAAGQLQAAVTAANQAGFRIKVAVVQSAQDLGAVPSLFDQPALYARFLGTELRSFYTSRLLVVMPSGFGFFDDNAPITAEQTILAQITIAGADSDSLVRAAADAVGKLRAGTASKTASPPPTVKAFAARGVRGQPVLLRYTVSSATGRSAEIVRVYGPNLALYATFRKLLAAAKPPGVKRFVTWRPAKTVSTTGLKFCVLAQSGTGSQSRPACAPIT